MIFAGAFLLTWKYKIHPIPHDLPRRSGGVGDLLVKGKSQRRKARGEKRKGKEKPEKERN